VILLLLFFFASYKSVRKSGYPPFFRGFLKKVKKKNSLLWCQSAFQTQNDVQRFWAAKAAALP
jgi:hypothetical protein